MSKRKFVTSTDLPLVEEVDAHYVKITAMVGGFLGLNYPTLVMPRNQWDRLCEKIRDGTFSFDKKSVRM